MDSIGQLLATEEIKKTKARYFRAIDSKNWAALKRLWTPDARWDASAAVQDSLTDQVSESVLVGPTAISSFIQSVLTPDCTSFHCGYNPDIAFTSVAMATGIWTFSDEVRYLSEPGNPERGFRGTGYYLDEYSLCDGQWLISQTVIKRHYLTEWP
jgi:hypothetical protein